MFFFCLNWAVFRGLEDVTDQDSLFNVLADNNNHWNVDLSLNGRTWDKFADIFDGHNDSDRDVRDISDAEN